MSAIGYWALLLALLLSLGAGAAAVYLAISGRASAEAWLRRAQWVVTALITLASGVLLNALVVRDYSFKYVAEYTDNTLPLFYAVTAFWGGQAGSLLFWTWTVALFAAAFVISRGYSDTDPETRTAFWAVFLAVQSFMLLALSNWSNPFIELTPAPTDGRGLNPLLQNPGMIFHPPLLFLGYAGFTIPASLALASRVSRETDSWLDASRNWTLTAWAFLTAGIILGAWWSYMELGWGGYWAWDPVENASLVPWLSATAFLHTAIVEERRSALQKTNVFLVSLTLLLCFFATYLVRSGVIDSLHAFGDGGVGGPLVVFMLTGLAVTLLALSTEGIDEGRPLSGLLSKTGLLVVAAWMLLAIGLVIGLGTMWPVISKIWSDNPVGLDAGFYNRVCLPLFAVLSVLLVFCPWLGWKEGKANGRMLWAILGVFIGSAAIVAVLGIRIPMATISSAAALAIVAGIALLFLTDSGVRARRPSWGAFGVHLGLGLMVLGIAVSGPYQASRESIMRPGESLDFQNYTFTYETLREEQSPAMAFVEAKVLVTSDGETVGELLPQRRLYRNFEQPFAEVSVVPSLGVEIYATLLGVDMDRNASIKFSVHPLINWIWIGGTIMCLAAFLAFRRGRGAR